MGPGQTTSGSKLRVSSREWYEGLEERAYLQFYKKSKTKSGSQSKGVRENALVCGDEEILLPCHRGVSTVRNLSFTMTGNIKNGEEMQEHLIFVMLYVFGRIHQGNTRHLELLALPLIKSQHSS